VTRLVLFTRFPEAGKAKTRLIPALGAAGAAQVHKVLTERTLALMTGAEVHFTGADEVAFTDWLGNGFTYIEQPAGDLTDRLLAALDPAPVIFFGADTPDLSAAHISAAIAALETNDVVIGPAEDGGYYLIGVAKPFASLFIDMPWSTERVLPETLARLAAMGIDPVMLETLSDCDRPEDVARWPWLAP
jgi:uncharacterized protein